ncbi:restriction endonuclease subunit S [Pseudobutyrivibrio sp. ACV-2]|uniref:restriction endonuclease subunit S n=1 Tax=Pseudobutyrivibrio sp. ACV-2 TaxID=1520801 RepID=UPI001FA77932|nr:restriction endonuclease subunit S [Pseudobutyrivibrio sp. ACV-2]
MPFEIPNGWEWCRLQTIASVLTDGTHKTPTYSDKGFVFLSSKNVTSGRIDWNNVMYIPESLHEELYSRLAPQVDDILLAKNGTTGVAAIVDKDCVFDIYVSLGLIRIVNKIILPKYVLYAIGSTFVQDYFKGSLKGIGVPNLHLEHIRKTLIPIPSENEQSHIVKKIEEILPYAEDINNQVDGLRYSVDSAKSKILDLAIQGKLVSQDPNDEPASVLLERIRAEKENLIKQGKLKLDKKESIIYKGDDNFYYTNPMFIRTFQEGNRFFTVFKPEKVRINIS